MGCVQGKSILTEEDINFIAKNTAMDKTQVEVKTIAIFYNHKLTQNLIAESVPDFSEKASRRSNFAQIIPHNDGGLLPGSRHREAWETHFQDVRLEQGRAEWGTYTTGIRLVETEITDQNVGWRDDTLLGFV